MTSELSNFAVRLHGLIRSGFDAADFGPLALDLFRLQFGLNAPYRRFCEARGVAPKNIGNWREIPAIPTSAFKELELSCLPVAERMVAFHSSGTTEQTPSRHFHNAESLAVYEASLLAWFEIHLLGSADFSPQAGELPSLKRTEVRAPIIMLTPPAAQVPQSSLAHMLEVVRRNFGAAGTAFVGRSGDDGAWTLSFRAALAALGDSCANTKPVLLLGTAFSFVHLLDHLAETDLSFKLPTGSRVMETGGYKGRSRSLPKAELHAMITARLGIPPSHIVCEYGMSELSSQAYDSKIQNSKFKIENPERTFQFPPWARAQIVSPETARAVSEGETGLIRVFDLANVFSVMAIQTEDLGVRRGDGFELIGRAALAEPRGCSLLAV